MDAELPEYCSGGIAYPGYCASLTGVTEFPGKCMRNLENLQKFRVRVPMS